MIYNLDLFNIGDSIVQACRTFVGWIAVMIYSLIEYLYHIFELLGRAEIIENDFVQNIYSKVGYILGIFMLFKLVFSLVQSLIEPEKLDDKKSGYAQIIKRCVISIVLLGITPSLFREAFEIQNLILEENVIYKLIAGNSTYYNKAIGKQLAVNLFFDFATDIDSPQLDIGMIDDYMISADGTDISDTYIQRFQADTWENLKTMILDGGKNLNDTIDYLAIKNDGTYVIELNWLPLLVVGCVVAYMIALYCIQVAVRVVQLAYLQLIAPIPILSYISDPESSFKNWLKQCLTTYLDFFIRCAIIYFVMTLISEVLHQFSEMSGVLYESIDLAKESSITVLLVKAFIIIGLLMFGKKVPDLLKDLFPNLGGGAASLGFGLKSPKKLLDEIPGANKALGFTAGALAGGAVGLIGGGAKGFFGGFTKGAYGGLKGKKIGEIASDRAAQNQRNRQARREGSTFGGRMDARFRNTFGLDSRTQQLDNQIHDIDVNTIRPIDDRINAIDNDPIMEQKRRNDAIIAAGKAMRDEAEKELLKAGTGDTHLRTLKADIENLRQNGTAAQIIAAEDRYKAELDRLTDTWIDSNHSNQVVSSGMQTISNETGRIVQTSAAVNAEDGGAKSGNATIASRVADLEHEKHELETQRTTAERQKATIERQKEPHQANENAAKR